MSTLTKDKESLLSATAKALLVTSVNIFSGCKVKAQMFYFSLILKYKICCFVPLTIQVYILPHLQVFPVFNNDQICEQTVYPGLYIEALTAHDITQI